VGSSQAIKLCDYALLLGGWGSCSTRGRGVRRRSLLPAIPYLASERCSGISQPPSLPLGVVLLPSIGAVLPEFWNPEVRGIAPMAPIGQLRNSRGFYCQLTYPLPAEYSGSVVLGRAGRRPKRGRLGKEECTSCKVNPTLYYVYIGSV